MQLELKRLDQIFRRADHSDSPGLVVGIALHGKPVYRRGFGLASVQHGLANLPTTRMRIASISKHFTSLACLLLAEDGRLDLDAPANRYLPELQPLEAMPSLRQFMAHTSGYRCTLEMATLANGLAIQPQGWQLRALARQRGTNFPPGSAQTYCNGCYQALSVVIERVSGSPFESFLQSRIFEPLEMDDTESIRDPSEMAPRLASLHVRAANGRWQRAPEESELLGDGGIVSSIDDMLRWLAHMHGPKIVGTEQTWHQFLEPVTLANGFRTTYSLGLNRHRYRGVEAIHHSGGLFGLSAQLLTIPEHGLDIVIMANGAPVSASDLSWRVVDTLLGPGHLKAARQRPAAERFRHLLGTRYRSASGLLIGFEEVDQALGLQLFNLPAAPVLYEEGRALRAGFEAIGTGPYEFDQASLSAQPDGSCESLTVTIAGTVEILERLPETAPSAAEIASISTGRYFCADLACEAEIAYEEPLLVLYLRGDYGAVRRLTLSPYSEVVYGVIEEGVGGARCAMSLDIVQTHARGFWLDTYRARRIRFDRLEGKPRKTLRGVLTDEGLHQRGH